VSEPSARFARLSWGSVNGRLSPLPRFCQLCRCFVARNFGNRDHARLNSPTTQEKEQSNDSTKTFFVHFYC